MPRRATSDAERDEQRRRLTQRIADELERADADLEKARADGDEARVLFFSREVRRLLALSTKASGITRVLRPTMINDETARSRNRPPRILVWWAGDGGEEPVTDESSVTLKITYRVDVPRNPDSLDAPFYEPTEKNYADRNASESEGIGAGQAEGGGN